MLYNERIMKQENIVKYAHIVSERIGKHFKRLPHTKYNLLLVHDKFDNSYNFFMEISRPKFRSRSIPLSDFPDITLEQLITIIKVIREKWTLTIEYRNFSDDDISSLRESLGKDF